MSYDAAHKSLNIIKNIKVVSSDAMRTHHCYYLKALQTLPFKATQSSQPPTLQLNVGKICVSTKYTVYGN